MHSQQDQVYIFFSLVLQQTGLYMLQDNQDLQPKLGSESPLQTSPVLIKKIIVKIHLKY